MEYRYACDRCGEINASNPHRCRNCGSTVFSPISTETLIEQSSGTDTPERIDPDNIGRTGTADPDVEYESSPGVAIDGSIETEDRTEKSETETTSITRVVISLLPVILFVGILVIWVL
ncbi:small CPxCG-related zinc finger protein [Natronomonas moolapensis 8.8.11]|uniref:Small CPxCG-related zinc finger protein n=1 Tax=Natronomonas moolapensis (strain DSM 18674 / CECT 7526 / JCM 14361 / 8.8.11) TaxID=268739 RepID=M1XQU2_NATM8|nr:small CPxCG-related zinc finger protein [Natronomonas moolapensis 8.8.11]